MNTLFNVTEYTSVKPFEAEYDPFWDEVILDCSGRVDDSGQGTLFYEDSEEAPEPDDYPTRTDYLKAWIDWEKRFPEQVIPPGSSWESNYRGYRCEFFVLEKRDQHQIEFEAWNDYLMCGNFQGNYDTPAEAELDFVEFIDETYPGERTTPPNRGEMMRRALDVPEENDSVLEEFNEDGDFIDVIKAPIQGWHFEEGGIYWHSSRNRKFKITKLFSTVSKAQGYFAGEIIKEKITLSELSPLPDEPILCAGITSPQQEVEPCLVNLEIPQPAETTQPAETLPEQVNSILQESTVNQWVESYYVTRSGSKYWYYRYCYYQGRIKHIHIPGGNTTNNKCLEMKARVEAAIALRKSPSEIKNFIKGGFGMSG
ncbi:MULTISPECIES: hypothetical protein [unclassified Nodularia (in: cyanobacteria)]|uniref:hypothetical protein n=1 Tax=unclassified Nodularia (in: cyanobacteria) TaxID=2656917 RepID=UPI001880EC0D|nr:MULTISPECIES: hypothetical protein [unclassified Nodularia (in: cyanobacteria)]MBE9202120.1 hypothetical protein [Nodularia sp. LEGE 06071]MCC2695170.1 hypothetical protein [Nodularia sp. LEGE 04288]